MHFKKTVKHWTTMAVLTSHLLVLPLRGQDPIVIQGSDGMGYVIEIPSSLPSELSGADLPFTAGDALYSTGWKGDLLAKLPMGQIDAPTFARTHISEANIYQSGNPYRLLGLRLIEEVYTKYPDAPIQDVVNFANGVANGMHKRSEQGQIKSGEEALANLEIVVKAGINIKGISPSDGLGLAKIAFAEMRKPYDDLIQSGVDGTYDRLVHPMMQSIRGMNNPYSDFYAPGSSYSLLKKASEDPSSRLAFAVDLYLEPTNKVRGTTRVSPSILMRASPEAARDFNIDRLLQDLKEVKHDLKDLRDAQTLSANQFVKILQGYKKAADSETQATEKHTKAIEQHTKALEQQTEQMKRDTRMRQLEKEHMVYRQIIAAAQAVAPESKEVAVAAAAASAAMQIQMILAAGLTTGATTAGIGAVVVLFVVAMMAIFSSGESADQIILREISGLRTLLLALDAKLDLRFREAAKHLDEGLRRALQRLDLLERYIRGDLKDITERIRHSHSDLMKLQDRTQMIGEVLHKAMRDGEARPIQNQIDSCLDTSPLAIRTFTESKYFDCLSTFLTCATHHASDSVSLQEWMGPQAVGQTGLVDLQEEFGRQFGSSLDWNKFRAFNEAMDRTVLLHRASGPEKKGVEPYGSSARVANPLLWAACVDAYLSSSKKRPQLYREFDPGNKKLQRLMAVAGPIQDSLKKHRNSELLRYLLNDYTEATRDFAKILLAGLRTHRDNPKVDLYAEKGGLDQKVLLAHKPILKSLPPCAWDQGFQKYRGHNGRPENLKAFEISGPNISEEAAKPFSDAMWEQVPAVFRIRAALGQGSIEWCYSDYGMEVLPTTWDRNFEQFTGHPTITIRARFLSTEPHPPTVAAEFLLKSDEAIHWAQHCYVVSDEGNRVRFGYQSLLNSAPDRYLIDPAKKEELMKNWRNEVEARKVEYDKAMNPASRAPYFRVAYGQDFRDALADLRERWDNGSIKTQLIKGKQTVTMPELLAKVQDAYELGFKSELLNKRVEVFNEVIKDAKTPGTQLHHKLQRVTGIRQQILQWVMFTLPEPAASNKALRDALGQLPNAWSILNGMERAKLKEDQKELVAKEFDLTNPDFIKFGEVDVREALESRLDKIDELLQSELTKEEFATHPLLSATVEQIQLKAPALPIQRVQAKSIAPADLEPKLWKIDDTSELKRAREESRKAVSVDVSEAAAK